MTHRTIFARVLFILGMLTMLISCQAAPAAGSAPAAPATTNAPAPAATEVPQAGMIIYASNRGSTPNAHLFIMDFESRAVTELQTPLWDVFGPKWSRDGSQILLAGREAENSDGMYLYIVNADGSLNGKLTELPAFLAEWSPDGKRVSFSSPTDGTADIFVVDVNGGNLSKLVDEPNGMDANMGWSPDGKKILFASDRSGKFEMYTYSLENGATLKLSNLEHSINGGAWSPDGKLTAYSTEQGLFITDADMRTTPVQLVKDDPNIGVLGWSPDSSRIVYSEWGVESPDLWLVDVKSGEKSKLTDDVWADQFPNWANVRWQAPAQPAKAPAATPTAGIIKASDQPIKIGEYLITINFLGYVDLGFNPGGGKETKALKFEVKEVNGKLDKVVALNAIITDAQGKWIEGSFGESGTNPEGKMLMFYNIYTSDATGKYYLTFPSGEIIELPR